MKKSFVDLFSGAGGMSCGLEMAGFQCLLGVDHDREAIETFKYNHKNSQTILGDIREVSIDRIQEIIKYQKVDLICGGPPCQGFSTYYHPTENRYLTAREAAAIQSFPHDFFFCGTVSKQWKQIGNAVPPLLAKALGESIFKLDLTKDSMKEAKSIENVSQIRAKAFSYKDKSKSNTDSSIQLALL
jgi:DNA (cytosine-5)-methyltransferase 1